MRIISTAALESFYSEGRDIRRREWPEGDYISADGAEGGTLWYYDASEDDLEPEYKLGFHELAADDWEFVPATVSEDDRLITNLLARTGKPIAGVTFRALWTADVKELVRVFPNIRGEESGFDQSAADFALMHYLRVMTDDDFPRMDRLFRRSALMREKFDNPQYREALLTCRFTVRSS